MNRCPARPACRNTISVAFCRGGDQRPKTLEPTFNCIVRVNQPHVPGPSHPLMAASTDSGGAGDTAYRRGSTSTRVLGLSSPRISVVCTGFRAYRHGTSVLSCGNGFDGNPVDVDVTWTENTARLRSPVTLRRGMGPPKQAIVTGDCQRSIRGTR